MLDNEYTVTQLSNMIKKSVETKFREIRLRGEVSALKVHTSGHIYFTLKDEASNIDCICWKFVAASQSLKLQDGIEIRCEGKVTTYPDRSKYQFIASKFELAGEGALLKLLEERKKKLMLEGVFDAAKKRIIPKYPRLIGIITSPTGAVIRDIMHRLEDRFPTPVLLYPVLVQGVKAAQQVIQAIEYMNNLAAVKKPDVLIVARGGGALEDLMPFNDEDLARAVANSCIPIISAVGHETDTTLIDLAADLRAPTPTAAAEFAVQNRHTLSLVLKDIDARLNNIVKKNIDNIQLKLNGLKLTSFEALLENRMQKVDMLLNRMIAAYTSKINRLMITLNKFLLEKPAIINFSMEAISTRLDHAIANKLSICFNNVTKISAILESCSMGKLFKRGFIYAELANGKSLTSKYDISEGDKVTMITADGQVQFIASKVKVI